MRCLVFLDFDGVIMTAESYEAARPLAVDRDSPTWTQDIAAARMDPALVARVSELCLRAEADIVLSTAWRGSTEDDRVALESALWSRGLDRRIPVLGQTPHGESIEMGGRLWTHCARGREIERWLDANRPGWTRDRIVILDDDSDMEPLMDRWVRCPGFRDGGFGSDQLAEALDLFGAAR